MTGASNVSQRARIGQGVTIGDFTIVHDDVVIEDGVTIGSHCVIGLPTRLAEGRPLRIGAGGIVRSHSTLYQGSTIGRGLQTGHYVLIRENSELGDHVQVGSQSDLEGDCRIGDYTKLHTDVHVAKGTTIGEFAYISPRVQFTNDDFPPSFFEVGATVGDMAVICTGTLLMPGVTVGLGAFVAAGSVVREDVPDVQCASGDPARPFSRLDKFFSLRRGMYHPWAERFAAKYPEESRDRMRELIARVDARLAEPA